MTSIRMPKLGGKTLGRVLRKNGIINHDKVQEI